MEVIQTRRQLHEYIDNSTDNVVEALLLFLKAKDDNIVVDEFIDLDEYNADIDVAMDEFKKGNFSTHEDVKRELKLL